MKVSREINYPSFEEAVFHKTGKRVRAWQRDYASLRIFILFDDNTEAVIPDGASIEAIEIKPIERLCASCGKQMHVSNFDWQGRCHVALKNFWEKVRRVYWHRYSKNKV